MSPTALETRPDPLDWADIHHFILTAGSYIERTRNEPHAYRVILPVPHFLQSAWTFPACRDFAQGLRHDRGDVWLVANDTEELGFHWRGLVVTERSPAITAERWTVRVGADPNDVAIDLVSSLGPEHFDVKLTRTVLWSCERTGPVDVVTDTRVVVDGGFRDLWRFVAER